MASPLRIKICGITRAEDARLAAELGADAVGLNFCPDSPRCIEPGAANLILWRLPPFVTVVGVFCKEPLARLHTQLGWFKGRINVVQWHGHDPEYSAAYPFEFVPAFAVRDEEGLHAVKRYLDGGPLPAAVLVDGFAAGQLGGTGHVAPWQLLADFKPGVPLILAGGLTPENVGEAVRTVRPYAVDVASGVESSPGIKDAGKMRRFIENARSAL